MNRIADGYLVRIGTFDEKMGPVCIEASKDLKCSFSLETCPGFKCTLIEDVINSKEDQIILKNQDYFYQGIKFYLSNPNKRGNRELFIILIKLIKDFGLLKEHVIFSIKADFAKLYDENNKTLSKIEIRDFINSWENKLNLQLDTTEINDEFHFYRDNLNGVLINIELAIGNPDVPEQEKKSFLFESLLNIYKIINYMNKKYSE